MINVRFILISILVAYLCNILVNFLFISTNSNKQIANDISIEEKNGNNIENEIKDEKEVEDEAEEEVDDIGENLNSSYKIQGREAIQVIRRAKTQNLPHPPSNNETKYGKYLGCYADKINKRILQDLIEKYHKTNTRRKCIDKCLSEGIPFAGVQYAEECFCGNERPPLSSKLPEDACYMTCTGAPDEICGGRLTINVFETGAAIPPDPPNIGSFKPPCKIQGWEAVSAIRRAKTEYCKQEIANVRCLIQKGDFYPEYLPHSCPNNGTQYGRYLGCYADKFKTRILPWKEYFPKTNTRQLCIDKCFFEGFPYAGVQYATECFCGNERPPSTSKWPENACDMICPGAPDEICGGSLTMNVFETGIAKFVPRTPTIPSKTTYTKPARIVFLLTINGRALRQVNRLINALYRPHHYIYIHVDARHDYLHRKLSVLEKRFPNIKMVAPRFTTIWGGVSLLKSLLSSMKNLFTFDWEWDFLINISECGFPINSIESLEKFLSVNKGLNFVAHHDRKYDKNPAIYESFVECEERMWRIGAKKPPKNMITSAGSDWYALSREFISYVVGPKEEFLTGITRFYNQSLFAAEAYFHHILRNTRFCNTYVFNNLHHVNWNWRQGCKCAYRHIVDWCGCSPMDFKPKDWERLQNAVKNHYFFARKFEPIINQEIINKVEKFIGADDYNLLNNLDGYWENIFDIEDKLSSKDDLFISHAKSITRINSNKINNKECSFVPGQVIQIHTYKKADIYEGNLVLHEVNLEGKNIILEALYKPKKLELNPDREYVERIKIFEVSSQYDQKEQVFRNFANILGPFTEPVLVYEISPDWDETDFFYIIWLDPAGRVAGINEIYVNTKNYTNFINSQLPTPLLPGIWKVGLFEDSKLILQTKFLITPFECFSRKELSSKKAGEINGGSQNSYPQFPQLPNGFFPKEETKTVMQEIATSNAKKTNGDLRKWIDELTVQFYDVKKSCVSQTKQPLRCGENVIDVCELTEWSSLSPDPKGTVGNLNKNPGKLERV